MQCTKHTPTRGRPARRDPATPGAQLAPRRGVGGVAFWERGQQGEKGGAAGHGTVPRQPRARAPRRG